MLTKEQILNEIYKGKYDYATICEVLGKKIGCAIVIFSDFNTAYDVKGIEKISIFSRGNQCFHVFSDIDAFKAFSDDLASYFIDKDKLQKFGMVLADNENIEPVIGAYLLGISIPSDATCIYVIVHGNMTFDICTEYEKIQEVFDKETEGWETLNNCDTVLIKGIKNKDNNMLDRAEVFAYAELNPLKGRLEDLYKKRETRYN